MHELGHVVAGLTQRFAFRWMTLGPVRVSLDGGRLRVGVNRVGMRWGGAASLQPLDDRDLPRRTCWFAAGGPLASLLIAVVTLVPSRMHGLRSDGGRLLDLLTDGPARQRECRIMAIAGAMSSGRRPSTWDAAIMHAILEAPQGSEREPISSCGDYRRSCLP